MTVGRHLDIITTEHSEIWQEIIDKITTYDTYHLPSYNELAELQGEGKAHLIVYQENDHIIAFPILLRDIKLPQKISGFENLKDVTGSYGYGGPISSPAVPPDVKERFLAALQDFFKQQKVITAFSRLHPFISNEHILSGFGEIREFGPIVYIDLNIPPSMQFSNYRRCHKQSVQRLREKGFECEIAGPEKLDDFAAIYYETMDRNEADSYYYFDRPYLEYLVKDMHEHTCMMLCFDGLTPISCCISFHCKGIVQAHIGGTIDRYLPLAPMKLVLDAVRLWANQIKAHTLNLGGGVGGWKDNVLAFKQGFSKLQKPCSVWRYVADQKKYDDICGELVYTTGIDPEGDYFPFYKNPAFKAES